MARWSLRSEVRAATYTGRPESGSNPVKKRAVAKESGTGKNSTTLLAFSFLLRKKSAISTTSEVSTPGRPTTKAGIKYGSERFPKNRVSQQEAKENKKSDGFFNSDLTWEAAPATPGKEVCKELPTIESGL